MIVIKGVRQGQFGKGILGVVLRGLGEDGFGVGPTQGKGRAQQRLGRRLGVGEQLLQLLGRQRSPLGEAVLCRPVFTPRAPRFDYILDCQRRQIRTGAAVQTVSRRLPAY